MCNFAEEKQPDGSSPVPSAQEESPGNKSAIFLNGKLSVTAEAT